MSDYKKTVALPQTTFHMRNVQGEEGIREFWKVSDIYRKLSGSVSPQQFSKWSSRFRIHDGPPYANGDIHMGHALNKLLKDFVFRSKYIMGQGATFVPGWDCHGLPIESQVEKTLIAEGRSRLDLSVVEFRALCRDYAETQVQKQMEQFKALGVCADWDNRYETKSFKSESVIVRAFLDLLECGHVYQGSKPVMWSQVESTSLAEAETEHKDIKTSQCWVRFPVEGHDDVSALVWTTTPWTLPANRALAYNSKMTYVILKVVSTTNPLVVVGEKLIMAESRVEATCENLGIKEWSIEGNAGAEYLLCYHPLSDVGYGGSRQFINASFVTDDAGTGIVHIAPEHGPEDFQLWMEYHADQEFESVLDDDCRYKPEVPLFAGEQILNPTPKGEWIFEFTNAKVLKAMEEQGTLAFTSKQVQSLPHSWRSHTPLIYRATPQWFLDINSAKDISFNSERVSVKEGVVNASKDVKFIPEQGRARFTAAVGGRPDWLVSRQRVWGTPMCLFVNKATGFPLVDAEINNHIVEEILEFGGDAWWTRPKEYWFDRAEDGMNPEDYEQVFDILDVWFDSGCTLDIVYGECPDQADLYLEGSDQHRGWFQSSALVNMARDNTLPFKTVLTHGFVLDHKGEKMSKSKGNVVDPREKAEQFGTDVLRYWVASSDYTSDLRVGDEILKTAQEAYRKVRNTFRYMQSVTTSNLETFERSNEERSILDWYMAQQCFALRDKVVESYEAFDFKEVVRLLSDFMSKELSAFYFDVNKDVLYCDALDSLRRDGYIWTVEMILHELKILWSPIIPHTIEELGHLHGPNGRSVLLYASISGNNDRNHADVDWDKVKEVIEAVNMAVEQERRREDGVQNLLDMYIEVWASPAHKTAFELLDVAQILRCSQAEIFHTKAQHGVIEVVIKRAEGQKCARSRLVLPEVGSDPEYPDLTLRDADAVRKWKATNE